MDAGWTFCRANFWVVALLAGVAGLASLLANLPGAVSDKPNAVLVAVLSSISALASALLALALLRRALDYWDEANGRAQPRNFGDALSNAVRGSVPRVFPWIGWNFVVAMLMAVILVPVIIIVVQTGSAAVGVAAVVIGAILLFVELVYLVFVPVAVADRPGNPLTASIGVVRGHFWTILGTIVLLALITIVAVIPSVIIVAIFGATAVGGLLTSLYLLVVVTVVEAVTLGAGVAMYRSVIRP